MGIFPSTNGQRKCAQHLRILVFSAEANGNNEYDDFAPAHSKFFSQARRFLSKNQELKVIMRIAALS